VDLRACAFETRVLRSDPCFIANAEEVRLRSFTTKIHKVDLMVSFRTDADGI
jgi:hypothetical protein